MTDDVWELRIGSYPPDWVTDAMNDGRFVPVQWPPKVNAWSLEGMRVLKTGRVVMDGEKVSKGELS